VGTTCCGKIVKTDFDQTSFQLPSYPGVLRAWLRENSSVRSRTST